MYSAKGNKALFNFPEFQESLRLVCVGGGVWGCNEYISFARLERNCVDPNYLLGDSSHLSGMYSQGVKLVIEDRTA